jgi:hypothetical protein
MHLNLRLPLCLAWESGTCPARKIGDKARPPAESNDRSKSAEYTTQVVINAALQGSRQIKTRRHKRLLK